MEIPKDIRDLYQNCRKGGFDRFDYQRRIPALCLALRDMTALAMEEYFLRTHSCAEEVGHYDKPWLYCKNKNHGADWHAAAHRFLMEE